MSALECLEKVGTTYVLPWSFPFLFFCGCGAVLSVPGASSRGLFLCGLGFGDVGVGVDTVGSTGIDDWGTTSCGSDRTARYVLRVSVGIVLE